MNLKKVLMIPTSAVLLTAAAGMVQADDSLPVDRLDEILGYTSDFGFTHYQEIAAEDGNRVEVEGWLDDEWFADVEFDLGTGNTVKEDRERMISGAWGMSEDDVRQAINVASEEGMVEFEEIDIDQRGIIDVEGQNDMGRDIEISVSQDNYEITAMDRD